MRSARTTPARLRAPARIKIARPEDGYDQCSDCGQASGRRGSGRGATRTFGPRGVQTAGPVGPRSARGFRPPTAEECGSARTGPRPIEPRHPHVRPPRRPDCRVGRTEEGQHRRSDRRRQMRDARVVPDIQPRPREPAAQLVEILAAHRFGERRVLRARRTSAPASRAPAGGQSAESLERPVLFRAARERMNDGEVFAVAPQPIRGMPSNCARRWSAPVRGRNRWRGATLFGGSARKNVNGSRATASRNSGAIGSVPGHDRVEPAEFVEQTARRLRHTHQVEAGGRDRRAPGPRIAPAEHSGARSTPPDNPSSGTPWRAARR